MSQVLHQTTRLSSGRHSSPDRGMCVVELASVLAGESFTDHPASVSLVIASFLRVYNDRVDAVRRQDLLPYAARVVGTRSDLDTERRRAARCMTWAMEALGVGVSRARPRLRRLARGVSRGSLLFYEWAARWVALKVPVRDDATHQQVLRLLDELIAIGPECAPGGRWPDAAAGTVGARESVRVPAPIGLSKATLRRSTCAL